MKKFCRCLLVSCYFLIPFAYHQSSYAVLDKSNNRLSDVVTLDDIEELVSNERDGLIISMCKYFVMDKNVWDKLIELLPLLTSVKTITILGYGIDDHQSDIFFKHVPFVIGLSNAKTISLNGIDVRSLRDLQNIARGIVMNTNTTEFHINLCLNIHTASGDLYTQYTQGTKLITELALLVAERNKNRENSCKILKMFRTETERSFALGLGKNLGSTSPIQLAGPVAASQILSILHRHYDEQPLSDDDFNYIIAMAQNYPNLIPAELGSFVKEITRIQNEINRVRVQLGLAPEPRISTTRWLLERTIGWPLVTPSPTNVLPFDKTREIEQAAAALPDNQTAYDRHFAAIRAGLEPVIEAAPMPEDEIRQAAAALPDNQTAYDRQIAAAIRASLEHIAIPPVVEPVVEAAPMPIEDEIRHPAVVVAPEPAATLLVNQTGREATQNAAPRELTLEQLREIRIKKFSQISSAK